MRGVVLLHGISRTARSLRAMERRLIAEGYLTANLDYPSRRSDLSDIVDGLIPAVRTFAEGLDGPLHLVTHSMGGLVARALLTRYRPPRLGRVVMLAPPNGGSEIADLLHRWWPYRRWFGPAGGQLGTRREERMTQLLGTIDYELGVIAGSRSINPLGSLLLPRPNDGRVSVVATQMPGLSGHIVLPTTHPGIVNNRACIEQAVTFLRDGHFAP